DGQRALAADRGTAPGGARLLALRRVPQRVPGVPANRWTRLRTYLPRAHRHPADRDAARHRVGEGAGPRLVALRGVQGGLPRPDRQRADAGRVAGGRGARAHRLGGRAIRLQVAPADADVAGRAPPRRAGRPPAAATVREGRSALTIASGL